MEKVLVVLQRDSAFELSFEEGLDLSLLNEKLNSQELNVLAIGDIVTHKSTILYIRKLNETLELEGLNINIQTHDDIIIPVKDEEYSPLLLENSINDYSKSFIMIGDLIINKHSIKTISPIK